MSTWVAFLVVAAFQVLDVAAASEPDSDYDYDKGALN